MHKTVRKLYNWAKLFVLQIQQACLLRVFKALRMVSFRAFCVLSNVFNGKQNENSHKF